MRYLLGFVLVTTMLSVKGQDFTQLEKVDNGEGLIQNKSIIYGNFIQRLGFSSGGFPQDIKIKNIDTEETFNFRVKPTYKSKKENAFVFHIPAGNYEILVYSWIKSKWYGGKVFTEPIFKGVDASTKEFIKKSESGKIKAEKFNRYKFIITNNTINYLGTWRFDTGLVSFSNNKIQLEKEIRNKYQNIEFNDALINIPK